MVTVCSAVSRTWRFWPPQAHNPEVADLNPATVSSCKPVNGYVKSSRWKYQNFRFKSWNIAAMGIFVRTAKRFIMRRYRRKFRPADWSGSD